MQLVLQRIYIHERPAVIFIFHPFINAVPATPITVVCAVYDMANEALQIIESTWNEVVGCVCYEHRIRSKCAIQLT